MYGNDCIVTDCLGFLCVCKYHTAIAVATKVTFLNSEILYSCCIAECRMLLPHHNLNDLLYRWHFDLFLRNC